MSGQTMLIPSLHKSDVARLTYEVKDCSLSAFAYPMPLGYVLALSLIFRPFLA